MRRALVASIAAVALGLGTLPLAAADLGRPVTKAPVTAPIALYNWTGFYVGVHAGYGWADKDWTQTSPLVQLPNSASYDADGFLAGGQVGFNWQTGQWVFGAELQWSWSDLNGSGIHTGFPTFTMSTDINWIGTLTGRLGYAWSNWLLYVKGGFAWADEDHTTTDGFNIATVGSTRTGWTVGGGVEVGLDPNWSVKFEYNYIDLGSKTYTFAYVPPSTLPNETWDLDQRIHIVKFGINYRFGGGPVVARY